MHKLIRIIAAIPAVAFISIGLTWWIQPSKAAAAIGLPLLDGVARSSQIGDLSAFFIASGSMALIGVITLQRSWFFASAMLVSAACVGRILAWAAHGAALPLDMIAPEVIITSILLLAAFTIAKQPA